MSSTRYRLPKTLALLFSLTVGACSDSESSNPDSDSSTASAEAAQEIFFSDARVAPLLQLCEQPRHYDVDTADVTAILVETLRSGQRDPLRRARSELAAAGKPAQERVRSFFNANYNNSDASGTLSNCLDVATLSGGPIGLEILRRGMQHPSTALRTVAIRGLAQHGDGSDFDALLERLPTAGPKEYDQILDSLPKLDQQRAETWLLNWIESDPNFQLWGLAKRVFSKGETERLLAFASAHWQEVPPPAAAHLFAALAQANQPAEGLATTPLEELRQRLVDESTSVEQRHNVLTALVAAGLWQEALPGLTAPDDQLRQRAVSELIRLESEGLAPLESETLRLMLNDSLKSIQQMGSTALLRRGDREASDRLMVQLEAQHIENRKQALNQLSPSLEDNPELCAQALRRLQTHALPAGNQFGDNTKLDQRIGEDSNLALIARIPSNDASAYLLRALRAQTSVGEHRKVTQWLANGGAPGIAGLIAELGRETQSGLRLNLIEALSATATEEARDTLLGILQNENTAPHEVLYVAHRLVQLGPAERILPVLKRVTLRIDNLKARAGLNCLLWISYPAPRVQ